MWSIIIVVLSSLMSSWFLFCNNAMEDIAFALLPVSVVCLTIGLAAYALTRHFTKRSAFSSVAISTFILVFLNGGRLLVDLLGFGGFDWRWFVTIAVAVLALFLICRFIYWKMREETCALVRTVFLVTLAGLYLINAVTVLPALLNQTQSSDLSNTLPAGAQKATFGKRPNIYYFIFDEYSGFTSLKKLYNYDNQVFRDFLIDKGFSVSSDSYNYSTATKRLLIDLFSLNYEKDRIKNSDAHVYLKQVDLPLFQVVESVGYTVYEAEASDVFDLPQRMDINVQNIQSSTIGGDNITQLFLQGTLLYPLDKLFATKEVVSVEIEGQTMQKNSILNVFDYYLNPNSYKYKKAFSVSYIKCPHVPFQFARDGSTVSYENRNNWAEKKYYLEQLQYLTDRITEMVNSILENDPNCIIILQSDHAARMVDSATRKDKMNILNAVYFMGKPIDIEGLNGINTLRTVLNKAFGFKMEMLGENIIYDDEESDSGDVKPIKLASSDFFQSSDGYDYTFRNKYLHDAPLQYAWRILDPRGNVLCEQPFQNDASFIYSPKGDATLYALGSVKNTVNGEIAEKLFGVFLYDTRTKEYTYSSFDLEKELAESTFEMTQEGKIVSFGNPFRPDIPELKYFYYTLDSNYNMTKKGVDDNRRTFTYQLEEKDKLSIVVRARIALGKSYEEFSFLTIASFTYDEQTDTYVCDRSTMR